MQVQRLTDGTLQQFSEDYSNDIDSQDGRKIFNITENVFIKSGGKDLIVERRRPLVEMDTIFFSLSNLNAQNYRFIFTAENLSVAGLEGFIEDTYLKTKTPLNLEGTTDVNFTAGVAGSSAANRFRIVFKQPAGPLPVTFTNLKAYEKNGDIAVEWKVENESNMVEYEVEKSTDGNKFSKAATTPALNGAANQYSWLDKNPVTGYNYYRIRSVDKNGKTSYTQVVKVNISTGIPIISIYPNPIENGITKPAVGQSTSRGLCNPFIKSCWRGYCFQVAYSCRRNQHRTDQMGLQAGAWDVSTGSNKAGWRYKID